MKIIDVNTSWGLWPLQPFPQRTIVEFERSLGGTFIQEAWVSAIESILHPEPDLYDQALFQSIRGNSRLRPVKTVNPLLANWHGSTRTALSTYPISALKLFPNYHGYSLASEAVDEVCRFAREKHLPVLVQMRVNDERNQPPFLQVREVPAQDIAGMSLRHPENVIVALCPYNIELSALAGGSHRLLADISFLDQSLFLENISEDLPHQRLVYGSHAPFLYAESAQLKLSHYTHSSVCRKGVAAGNLLAATAESDEPAPPLPFYAEREKIPASSSPVPR